MNISDEAVEAAAKALYERKFGPEGWDGLPDKPRKQYADDARFILEAAAPHLTPVATPIARARKEWLAWNSGLTRDALSAEH